MEKMTIHRGLTELKLLNSRIHAAIREGSYCAANKKSNKKINGMSVDEYRDHIRGSYDKAVALINRRDKIKTAIVDSNAKTIVQIGNQKMTVAQAIERKNSIEYDNQLLVTLKTEYKTILGRVNKENEELPRKFETYLQSFGGKENMKPDEVEEHRKLWMAGNEWDFIDPLKIDLQIKTLEDSIQTFIMEVDATLSESNAVTFIEI